MTIEQSYRWLALRIQALGGETEVLAIVALSLLDFIELFRRFSTCFYSILGGDMGTNGVQKQVVTQ